MPMKIISQDDRKIVIQSEEFIVNLNRSQIVLTIIVALLFIWTVLPSAGGGIFKDTHRLWELAQSNRTNPLFIGVAVFGTQFNSACQFRPSAATLSTDIDGNDSNRS
jgi:hypothetical protein